MITAVVALAFTAGMVATFNPRGFSIFQPSSSTAWQRPVIDTKEEIRLWFVVTIERVGAERLAAVGQGA